jgi:molybdate transport system regulatory protein
MSASAAQPRHRHTAILSVRLRFGADARIGPGKIALLEAIARTGSIAAAGREMGMSYRRAWLLIDSLNRMFDAPVVHASSGGAHGGGAGLSALGEQLVTAYRAMERDTERAVARHFEGLKARMVVDDSGASSDSDGQQASRPGQPAAAPQGE